MSAKTDAEETAIIQKPYRSSTSHHLPSEEDDNEPKCNCKLGKGEWTPIPVEEVPDRFDKCKDCHGLQKEREDEKSLLMAVRNGDPEDFGLESIPNG